jgi:hypothetical protein
MNQRDRRAVLSGRIADHARRHGEPLSVRQVCAVCAETLGVDGCVLAPVSAQGRWTLACTVGDRARVLADLQFALGEGPGLDAIDHKTEVMVEDLDITQASKRWPLFVDEAIGAGIRSVFTFPLTTNGSKTAGVLQLYRAKPERLNEEQRLDGEVFADLALSALLDNDDETVEMQMGERAVVYQATGMIAGALNLTVDEALVRLRYHSYTQNMAITHIARAITTGEISPHID